MIRSLFVPTALGSYYLFAQRLLGIEITKTELRGTLVIAQGNKRTIEQYLQEPIAEGDYQTEAHYAFVELIKKAGKVDTITVVIPSTGILFKELSLPFIEEQKIKLVLPFEIESLLPFSLAEATIDSITLATHAEQKKSDVLVAVAKKEYLNEYASLYQGTAVEKVSVDSIELYSLYQAIPEYRSIEGIVVLLDVDFTTTRIIILHNGKPKLWRTLAKGFAITNQELSQRIDFASAPEYIQEKYTGLVQDIQFTLQAAVNKIGSDKSMQKIMLAGIGNDMPGYLEFIEAKLGLPCERFYAHKIVQNGQVTTKQSLGGIPQSHTNSLAAALALPLTAQFNLSKNSSLEKDDALLSKQLIAAGILLTVLLGSFFIYSSLSIRSLAQEVTASEKQAIQQLRTVFPLLPNTKSLIESNNNANIELTKEESIWFALSTNNRFSFLRDLETLSSRIDREKLGLDLKKLTIKAGDGTGLSIMTIEGSVKNYDGLREFEEALIETKLFKTVPRLQETKFGTITLVLDKDQRDEE